MNMCTGWWFVIPASLYSPTRCRHSSMCVCVLCCVFVWTGSVANDALDQTITEYSNVLGEDGDVESISGKNRKKKPPAMSTSALTRIVKIAKAAHVAHGTCTGIYYARVPRHTETHDEDRVCSKALVTHDTSERRGGEERETAEEQRLPNL